MSTSEGGDADRDPVPGYDDLDAEDRADRLEGELLRGHHLAVLGALLPRFVHDLKNELMVIDGNATLAAMAPGPGDDGRRGTDHLSEIRRAAARAASLADQLRRHARRGRLDVVPVDIATVLAQARELLGLVVPTGVTLRVDVAGGVPAVLADADRLREVIVNLVANASEAIVATGRAGSVTIRSEVDGDRVVLVVTDDGEGIDPAHLDLVAEPLFTTRPGRAGVGLAVVQDTLLALDGTLSFASTSNGTSARVSLPVAAGAPVMADDATATADPDVPTPTASTRAPNDGVSGTVLIVDDDDSLRILVRRVLDPMGVTVVDAADGDLALTIQREGPEIDLVLLDVTMPGRDGDEVFRAMRAVDPGLPVVVLTGYSDQETRARFPDDAGIAFLHKPFDIHDLRSLVAASLSAAAGRGRPG